MKISSAFPSKYLKASDIPDGRDVIVKIDVVRMEIMTEAGTEEKPILYFVGKEKGLVLNQTNAGTLATALGDDTETWHGQTVTLFTTTTQFNGRTVPCIRLRVPRQAPPAPQRAPVKAPVPVNEPAPSNENGNVMDDDIPF